MKVDYYNDKIVVYVINRKASNDIIDIRDLLWDVFNNLIDNYDIDIRDNYDINIYINDLYGSVVEIIKVSEDSTRLNVFFDKLFLYEIDDPLDYIENEIYYYNDKYYLNVDKLDIKLFENSKLIYDDFVYKVLGRGIKI